MEILEKLYDCADKHLAGGAKDWVQFSSHFKEIFDADILVYQANFSLDSHSYSSMELLGSSNMPMTETYIEQKMYQYHPMPESGLPTLEPIRRTDHTPDDVFIEGFGAYGAFLLENDIFYLMMVHEALSEHSFLALALWRGRADRDFEDQEKQRLALLMRYILALSGGPVEHNHTPTTAFQVFAERYGLTPTETGILDALIQGQSPKEIALETGRTYGTVRWHVQNILEKSQVGTQKQLMREFYELLNSAVSE